LKINEWPKTDLLPILEKENVTGKFHISGTSLGTQFATATAQVLTDRILSIGLRVPYLPLKVSKELDLPNGQPTLPKIQDVVNDTCAVKCIRCSISVASRLFGTPSGCMRWCMRNGLLGSSQKGTERFFAEYERESKYASTWTNQFPATAMMYLVAQDVALDIPGVDPRLIDEKLIPIYKRMVWYASDDDDCPPSHGKWLAETGWKGCNGNVRVFEQYNHLGGSMIDQDQFFNTLIQIGSSEDEL